LVAAVTGGGQPERLTELGDSNLYADFSPDGQFIAFMGSSSIYVMRPDGNELIRLRDAGPFGALA
jgi:Tol biopolymer transport system component